MPRYAQLLRMVVPPARSKTVRSHLHSKTRNSWIEQHDQNANLGGSDRSAFGAAGVGQLAIAFGCGTTAAGKCCTGQRDCRQGVGATAATPSQLPSQSRGSHNRQEPPNNAARCRHQVRFKSQHQFFCDSTGDGFTGSTQNRSARAGQKPATKLGNRQPFQRQQLKPASNTGSVKAAHALSGQVPVRAGCAKAAANSQCKSARPLQVSRLTALYVGDAHLVLDRGGLRKARPDTRRYREAAAVHCGRNTTFGSANLDIDRLIGIDRYGGVER